MALCNVTGTVYLPSGDVASRREVVFFKVPDNVTADYLGAVVPEPVVVRTDNDGAIDVRLITGNYHGYTLDRNGKNRYQFKAVVPEAATADFADLITAVDPVEPLPAWLQQVLQARDEAVQAADDALAIVGDLVSLQQAVDDAEAAADSAAQNAASIMPYPDRATAEAAAVDAGVDYISVGELRYVRDPNGTALTTAGGDTWSPAGEYYTPSHWGAPTDGVTDSTPFFQAMFDWAKDDPTKKGRDTFDGVRYFATGMNVIGSVRFDAGIAQYNLSGTYVFLVARGNPSQSGTALTASYVTGSDEIAVALPVIPRRGTWIRIASNAVNIYDRSRIGFDNKYRMQEFAMVGEGSTSSIVKLAAPLRFVRATDSAEVDIIQAYSTAQNARVAVFDETHKFEWNGGIFDMPPALTNSVHNFNIVAYMRPKVTNATTQRGFGAFINLVGTMFAMVDSCNSRDLANNNAAGQNGYGVSDGGWYTTVSNCEFRGARHSYTTYQRTLDLNTESIWSGGMTVGSLIVNCTSYGSTATHFDCHHGSIDITFRDCMAVGGATGYGGRGVNVQVVSCRSRGTSRALYGMIESVLTACPDPDAVPTYKYIDCDLEGWDLNAIDARLSNITIENCILRLSSWRQVINSSSIVTFVGNNKIITARSSLGNDIVTPTTSFLFSAELFSDGSAGVAYGIPNPTISVARASHLDIDARGFTSILTGSTRLLNIPSQCRFEILGSAAFLTTPSSPNAVWESGNGTFGKFPDSAIIISNNLSSGDKITGINEYRPDGTVV